MSRNLRIAVGLVLAAGIVMRLAQYLHRGALWVDETTLALSIVPRPAKDLLFTPLFRFQMAPPGFLQAAKASVTLFGPTEPALRLPALIVSIAALVLFAALARKILEGWEIFFAVTIFALSPMVLVHTADAKQYMFDLAAALILTIIVLKLRHARYSPRWSAIGAAAGLIAVWFSDASAFVLGGMGLALVTLAFAERDRVALRSALVIGPAWGLALAAQQLGAQRRMAGGTREYMQNWWEQAFMPVPPGSRSEVLWIPLRISDAYAHGLGLRPLDGLCAALGLFGFVQLWRRGRRDAALILGTPIAMALVASAARLYPFDGRLILFLFPALVIALAAGAGGVSRVWQRRAPLIQLAILLALLNTPRFVFTGERPRWRRQEVRPVLATLQQNRRPGDSIFVYSGSIVAMLYYGPRYGIKPGEWSVFGYGGNPEAAAERIRQLRGLSRVWLFFSHDYPQGTRAAVVSLFDQMGTRQPGGFSPPDPLEESALYLYDLSER